MSDVLAAEVLMQDGTTVQSVGNWIVLGRDGKHLTVSAKSAPALAAVLTSVASLMSDETPIVAATPTPSVQEAGARTPTPTAGRPAGVAESSPPSSSATPDQGTTGLHLVRTTAPTPSAVAAALARRPRRAPKS